jgi:hypothetical protein
MPPAVQDRAHPDMLPRLRTTPSQKWGQVHFFPRPDWARQEKWTWPLF